VEAGTVIPWVVTDLLLINAISAVPATVAVALTVEPDAAAVE
jgi:hypothetical protein